MSKSLSSTDEPMLPIDMLSKLGLGLTSSISSSSSSSEEEENCDDDEEEEECDADGAGEDARMLVYRSEDALLGESAPSLPLLAPSS